MKKNGRFFSLIAIVVLICCFSPAVTGAPVVAAQTPYVHLHSFSLICVSGGTTINVVIRADTYFPQGYYLKGTNSMGWNATVGPFADDYKFTNVFWDNLSANAPYSERGRIYNPAGQVVYELGWDANCDGVADGDQAHYTYWSGAVGSGPGPDMVYIPPEAVVGTFTSDTPLYGSPDPGVASEYVMKAGQSLWVLGLDSSGQFYKVLLSGQPYWVPATNIGPTYDDVWNGRPLPSGVVN